MSAMHDIVARLMAPLKRRVDTMISRAVLTLVTDTLKIQNVQVNGVDGELISDLENFQPQGFTAVAKPGAEALILSVGGVRAAAVVIGVNDRTCRPTGMGSGDACMYGAASGPAAYLNDAAGILYLGAGASSGVPAKTGDFPALNTNTESRIAALENWCVALMVATSMGPAAPAQPLVVAGQGNLAATKVKIT